PVYGYQRVNVEAQRRDAHSMLNWMERTIRMRKECPEIGWGDWKVLGTAASDVLAMRYDWRGHSIVTLHNFSDAPRVVRLGARAKVSPVLVDLLGLHDSRADRHGGHIIELDPYAYKWLRSRPPSR